MFSCSKSAACRIIVLSSLCLIAGAVIYVLFREPVYFTESLDEILHLPVIKLKDGIVTTILLYYVPDALWCLALMLYATVSQSQWFRTVALICPAILEVLQLSEHIPGTFDPIDLSIYLIISIIFFSLWKKEDLPKQSSIP